MDAAQSKRPAAEKLSDASPLPCPFCGASDPELDYSGESPDDASDAWFYCTECLCDGPVATIGCRDDDESVDLEREATELWNKRATVVR